MQTKIEASHADLHAMEFGRRASGLLGTLPIAILGVLSLTAAASAQAPGGTFTQAVGIAGIGSTAGATDFGGTAGHVAANSRGDVLVAVANGSTSSYLMELTAASGLQTQVALITGMAGTYGGHSAFVDASGNVYATDTGDAQIVYVPFVNGAYPSGAAYSSLSNCSAFPVPSSQITACKVPLNYTAAFGYYIQAADVALDGQGNLYLIDKYTGGSVTTQVNKIVEFPAASNNPVVLLDNLSNQASAELAVDAVGDIWYEDGTGNNYYLAAGTSSPVSLSIYYVTGVSIDAHGTVYFTESNSGTPSSSQILALPQVSGTACAGTGCLNNQYTITNQLSTGYSTYPSNGVGIDSSGRLYFAGSYPNSLSSLYVNSMVFGTTPVNTTSGSQTFYLNFGNNNAYKTFNKFALAGPFAVSSTTCVSGTTYGPYATPSCTVAVTFQPTAGGAATGTLNAIDTSNLTIVIAALSGTGALSTTITGAATTVYGTTPTYTATAGQDGTYSVAITGTVTSSASVTISGGSGSFALPALGVGSYTLSLTAAGATATTGVSITAAVLTVTAANAGRSYDAANPLFAASYSGFQFSDNSSVVSGTPAVSTTATPDSPAGTYPIVVSAGTAIAANYSISNFVNGTLAVAGGTAQNIYFPPLPNFVHGSSVVLTAVSTSGLPITYSVITGSVSVSGSTLTITGAGTVTVQAAQPGNASYAAATSMQRSFNAQ